MHLSTSEHILACSSVHPFAKTYFHVHPFVKSCSYMLVHEHISLYALSLFIPYIVTSCLFMYLSLQSLMTRRHQVHKPPSLPWCMVIPFRMQVSGRRDKTTKLCKVSFKLRCEHRELMVKIAQRPLRDWEGQSRSAMIVHGIWLGWRTKLQITSEGSSGGNRGPW